MPQFPGPARPGDFRPARDMAYHEPRESNNLYHNVFLLQWMAAPASQSSEIRSRHALTKSGSMLLPNHPRQQPHRLGWQQHARRLRRQQQTQAGSMPAALAGSSTLAGSSKRSGLSSRRCQAAVHVIDMRIEIRLMTICCCFANRKALCLQRISLRAKCDVIFPAFIQVLACLVELLVGIEGDWTRLSLSRQTARNQRAASKKIAAYQCPVQQCGRRGQGLQRRRRREWVLRRVRPVP